MKRLLVILVCITFCNISFSQRKPQRGANPRTKHPEYWALYGSFGYKAIYNSESINKYFENRNSFKNISSAVLYKKSIFKLELFMTTFRIKSDYSYDFIIPKNEKLVYTDMSLGYGYYIINSKIKLAPFANISRSQFHTFRTNDNIHKTSLNYNFGIRTDYVIHYTKYNGFYSIFGEIGNIYENYNSKLNGFNYYFSIGIGFLGSDGKTNMLLQH